MPTLRSEKLCWIHLVTKFFSWNTGKVSLISKLVSENSLFHLCRSQLLQVLVARFHGDVKSTYALCTQPITSSIGLKRWRRRSWIWRGQRTKQSSTLRCRRTWPRGSTPSTSDTCQLSHCYRVNYTADQNHSGFKTLLVAARQLPTTQN